MNIVTTMRGLPIGGSTITALELVAAMRDRGHDVSVVAGHGPAVELASELGVPTVTSTGGARGFATTLRSHLRYHRPDVVHAWDWQNIAVTHAVASLDQRLAVMGSITAIDPTPFLPDGIPVGFVSEIMRRRDPRPSPQNFTQNMPINTATDRPGLAPPSAADGLELPEPGRTHAVLVTRLAHYMKLESVLAAIAAIDHLGSRPVDLTIVGGGEALDEVRNAADRANAAAGETRVRLTGEMRDPRPAYESADVIIGMGSSILRGMSFGVPAIVVGEDGFALVVTPDNVDAINAVGFYGLGRGVDDGPRRLAGEIASLVDDPEMAAKLASFSRDHVVAHHDTGVVAAGLLDRLERARDAGPVRSATAVIRNGGRFAAALVRKAGQRVSPAATSDPHTHKPQEYRDLT